MDTTQTIEKVRRFLVVVRVANYCKRVRRGYLPGQLSLLHIATEEFGLTFSQYQSALVQYRKDMKAARDRDRLLAA